MPRRYFMNCFPIQQWFIVHAPTAAVPATFIPRVHLMNDIINKCCITLSHPHGKLVVTQQRERKRAARRWWVRGKSAVRRRRRFAQSIFAPSITQETQTTHTHTRRRVLERTQTHTVAKRDVDSCIKLSTFFFFFFWTKFKLSLHRNSINSKQAFMVIIHTTLPD